MIRGIAEFCRFPLEIPCSLRTSRIPCAASIYAYVVEDCICSIDILPSIIRRYLQSLTIPRIWHAHKDCLFRACHTLSRVSRKMAELVHDVCLRLIRDRSAWDIPTTGSVHDLGRWHFREAYEEASILASLYMSMRRSPGVRNVEVGRCNASLAIRILLETASQSGLLYPVSNTPPIFNLDIEKVTVPIDETDVL
jgi:hypothetical protein